MIWKNPFLSKNSEQQFRVKDFLSLFDCTVLQMIDECNLSKVSYVSSTPGAGKTSLFRAFSPQVLSEITSGQDSDKYKDICGHMQRLGTIRDNESVLLSANLSCARNYSIIDEMFENGRRKHVFFALINYRIAIAFVRAMGMLWDIDKEDYKKITFVEIPQEMLSECGESTSAYEIYEWACKGEKELCRYLDSDRSDNLEISFVHTTLLMIKLFEPDNILFDGERCFDYTLMIFDDFHKLSENQKVYVSEALYTLKTNTGVWLGQRLEGVKTSQLISMDGSLSRDYNPNIVIDNYWPSKQKQYRTMLQNIANRRVQESEYVKFSDCLSERPSWKKYSKALKKFIQAVKNNIEDSSETQIRYADIIEAIEGSEQKELFDKAIYYECIVIKENRRNAGQLSLSLGITEDAEAFMTDFVNENKKAAHFYVCRKCAIPFYSGMDNLLILSSYNVEQFLNFAGVYFDVNRIKLLENGNRRAKALTAEEQEEILKQEIMRRWADMDLRYANIEAIKGFLNNISQFCIRSRDDERNSYEGGAYTGFAIKSAILKKISDMPQYSQLIEVLGACLASKYLERREESGGQESVFYLNRWLCVYYGLPLAYGGFKRTSEKFLLEMCKGTVELFDEFQTNCEI